MRRAGVVAVVATLLVATVPAFGNMVNYSPDALMLHGGPPHVGLGGFASTVDVGWGPWLAWLPSGNGNVDTTNVPAPWIGTPTTAELSIYTPPGYDPTKSRRYPTLYEAPTPFGFWDAATNVKVALDTLIDTGAIPAAIVVFISSGGGPYDDSECADWARPSSPGSTRTTGPSPSLPPGRSWVCRRVGTAPPSWHCITRTYSARRSSSPATFMLESPLAPTPLSPSVVIRRSSMRPRRTWW